MPNDNHPETSQSGSPAHSGPLVSIIIPYYRQEKYIAQTVLSARNQTYPHVEVIVIDDESPTPAEPYLTDISGITLLRTRNAGCPATRNAGFRESSGEFLIFLDGDDLLRPDAVETHLKSLQAHPEASLTFGAVRLIDGEGRETRPPHICRPRKDYFAMLLETNPVWSPGATMMRRDAFVEAGMFQSSLDVQVDDYELYLRLARRRPWVQHPECVLDYRLHGSNVSKDQEKMLRGTLGVLDRLAADPTLTPAQRTMLQHGRQRWIHAFRPAPTLGYRLQSLYYTLHSLGNVPVTSFLSNR